MATISNFMEYLALIGTVTIIHLLAVISPGPDFIIACRNSLSYSRKTGIWTAVGFGFGIAVHVFYSLAGLALVISKSILLFNAIKFLGAGYLIYIGLKSILSKSSKIELGEHDKKEDITHFAAIRIGFLTNVLNPKATLFFLSLFTLVISPTTPFSIMAVMSAIMVINTMLWFSLVAVFLTQKRIRSIFERFQGIFNKTLGGLLIALGVKIALTEK
ncbi:MAG: LysE family translocator [bacterium]|nr:LysE family translocator [bacterium]